MPRPIRSHGGEAVSASLSIKLDVIAGTHAQHAARALARIAQQLWVLTEANFNGTRMFANPGETGDAVYLRWTVDSSDGDAHQTSEERKP